jgi:predicted ATPase/DNA-binding winged helix-turn-helix (wHTH) protein
LRHDHRTLRLVTYAFGEYVLDLQLFQLRRGDEVVPLEPKVFDVLRYLVEHHDRVATKRELLDALWPNEVVTEAVLPTNINALRRALGQGRGAKQPIETVHGRGYRFATPVARSTVPAPTLLTPQPPALDLPDDEGALVGQVALLDKLKRALSRALSEQGQICILRGETGIGKSRIAKSVADLARAQGADVWQGACPEGLGTPPLWIWQEVLRSAKASEGGPGLRRVLGASAGELSPWLYELLEDGDENLLVRGERDRFRLYDVLVRLLSSAAKVRPRVLLLEDLHRADDASWQLLRLLAPHLAGLAVLVLCTVRSRDDLTVAMDVQRHVEDLARLPFCQRFQVSGLDEAESHSLLERRLGRAVQPELTRLLYQKTGGNPLFLRELSEGFADPPLSDVELLREASSLSPPELVRRVLLRRVERLGEAAQTLLSAASVIGNDFELAHVAELVEMPHEDAMDVVDAALDSRVITAVPDRFEAYRFAHDLVRDTLYTELRSQERKRLHQRAAELLARKSTVLDSLELGEVAQHYYRALPAADPELAASWLTRAAQEAEGGADYDGAARYFRFALDAMRLLSEPSAEQVESLKQGLERVARLARSAKVNA